MSAQNGTGEARAEQLAANLARVEQRIADACRAAGRDREEVTLVVVTKTYPASDVRLLAGLGVREVAENRDQDAAGKAAETADLPLSWHFVGQLQTNKARSVVRYADHVHSVDRLRLVEALSSAATAARRQVGCLVQVALDAEAGDRGERGGVAPDAVPALADALAAAPGLRLDGLMTVAPLAGAYAGQPRAAFDRLMEISSRLRETHPAATMVSAGMSQDLDEAVTAGATHVRVGTAVLGVRPGLR
ncbi:YggS family pyridoxal phosphate-dependent enzyme [Streptomyces cocklensis]|uniref:Pyridoxal phosphate homeostasis protein n=1 Tax=Actinacidiphila cocklensis TaxID=887465 RepID=A0A9W4DSV5_9ACTN|nr:YggS family pyridoxal phosphate-dependent enzyme [Actinacidiphila cocklensis]MDD1060422.1 YggS family pyridoxal phosphate-dependent enzyme [Actinacidiphila cocklensis]CAG6395389.1 Pyridoxal phosphate homeostasis protein [Actinacidiphila cocklensis]